MTLIQILLLLDLMLPLHLLGDKQLSLAKSADLMPSFSDTPSPASPYFSNLDFFLTY